VTLKYASGFVVVPSVSGLSCADASRKLQNLTFKPSCHNQPSQNPKDQAFATSPGTGTKLAQDSPVTIFISTGPSLTNVPNVVGENAGQAKKDLRAAGFAIAITQKIECIDQTQNNIVSAQTPNGNTQAPRGATVSITVIKYRPNDPTCNPPPGST
jgi:serine/threonine-protein kinase